MKKVWTPEMEQLLTEKYPILPMYELLPLFPGLSKSAVSSHATQMNLTKKGKLISWRYEHEEILKQRYSDTLNSELAKLFGKTDVAVSGAAYKLGLKKPAEFIRQHAFKTTFKPGIKAWNKGMKQAEYMSAEAIAKTKATRFVKGQLPHNSYNEVGKITIRHEHPNRNNSKRYQYICLELGKWKPLHVYNWEKKNGKVPKGHCLWFIDGDTLNAEPSNLELITRAENMQRNSGAVNLPDGMVAAYMARESHSVNKEKMEEYLKHPDLIELKRKQLLLNRAIKSHEKTGNR